LEHIQTSSGQPTENEVENLDQKKEETGGHPEDITGGHLLLKGLGAVHEAGRLYGEAQYQSRYRQVSSLVKGIL